MPDGFSEKELAKPPGRRELQRIDKEYEALRLWYASNDLKAVRDGIPGVTSLAQARILVNRAVERYLAQRTEEADRMFVRHSMMLDDAMTKLHEAIQAGDLPRAQNLVSVQERLSKLHDLDLSRKEQTQLGVQIVVNAGLPDIPDVPLEAEIVETQKQLEPPD